MLLKAAMPFNFSSPEHLSSHKRRKNWVSPISRASPANMNSPLVTTASHAINPLSVSVHTSGKNRSSLDLRHVNKCLSKKKINYDDWKIELAYFEQNRYMFSFDLKSG